MRDALRFESGRPQVYRILVQGTLDASWSDRLAGLQITSGRGDMAAEITALQGRIRDQAELAGVLNTLHDLHLPILSVEVLKEVD
jgi:hypothetical protein